MFEFIRTHTKLLQLLLLLLILPSFIVFGIQGYTQFTEGQQQAVATVDGQAISQGEWDAAHQQQVERIRQQAPNLDPKMFDTPEARAQTLEALVRERVMQVASRKLHLPISDDRLRRLFIQDPQFATIRNADGSVNKELLQAQGMTSEGFAERLRLDLAIQQVSRGVTDSSLASPSVVSSALDAMLQRREVRVARFDAKEYLARVDPSQADLQAYYTSHPAEFVSPEQAEIEYVVLDLETLSKGLTVPEADAKAFYEANVSRYTAAEERRARHILIKADKSSAPDVRQKARAQAETLVTQARQNPKAFADLARKNSQDEGSAAQGGDLDFFSRGAMTKPFEDAVYAMKPGEVSNVVETEFGYHVILLEATRGGERQPFEAVRASIEDDIRRQLAQKRWAEAAEQFTNTVYEQPDSLQPVIEKLKLDRRTATVGRTPAPGATGALASAKLLDAVFATDAVKNKRNTDGVEVGPNQLAAARVTRHQPTRTLPLDEVKDRVAAQVRLTQAVALARKDGEARLAQARSGGNAAWNASVVVSRVDPAGQPRPVVDAVLRADASRLPAHVGVDLPGQGYVAAQIDKVLPREVKPEESAQLQSQYVQLWAQAESAAYYQALRKRYQVELKADPKAARATDAAASAASR
ncbi:MAG: SurA N-terminal domain-containing protein [Aquabacterium sp.]|nr:SurA N-terminal domain-containing protein [Aquabacterium sp.]